eukprot:TRINITY_DN65339_c0_g1_i1.p2 TRINITY_DN65339_c0_g1~~TRINITY_DN65339_c0_g1_i1.p2  ORF type:complete len:375 (+),score=115.31 TRINITY_DN65339_c0_g1_i1:74-1198(+)
MAFVRAAFRAASIPLARGGAASAARRTPAVAPPCGSVLRALPASAAAAWQQHRAAHCTRTLLMPRGGDDAAGSDWRETKHDDRRRPRGDSPRGERDDRGTPAPRRRDNYEDDRAPRRRRYDDDDDGYDDRRPPPRRRSYDDDDDREPPRRRRDDRQDDDYDRAPPPRRSRRDYDDDDYDRESRGRPSSRAPREAEDDDDRLPPSSRQERRAPPPKQDEAPRQPERSYEPPPRRRRGEEPPVPLGPPREPPSNPTVEFLGFAEYNRDGRSSHSDQDKRMDDAARRQYGELARAAQWIEYEKNMIKGLPRTNESGLWLHFTGPEGWGLDNGKGYQWKKNIQREKAMNGTFTADACSASICSVAAVRPIGAETDDAD